MLSSNLKYYRQQAHMSQEHLAQMVGLTKMAISNYESGKREADSSVVIKLARALGVSASRLLATPNASVQITHGAFRKQSKMGINAQALLFGQIDRYLNRFYNALQIVGSLALPEHQPTEKVPYSGDIEAAGQFIRQYLKLSLNGPVGNITDIIENQGIIVCQLHVEDTHFSGINGMINGRPYIVVNSNMPAERQRFTVIHELSHILFSFADEDEEEKAVDGIAGAFLFPSSDVYRELGTKRTNIRGDLRSIQREYGIAMQSILIRAKQCGVITQESYEAHCKWISANHLRLDEHSGLVPEKSTLFEQLVVRAVSENMIGISKASELLELPYHQVELLCCGEG